MRRPLPSSLPLLATVIALSVGAGTGWSAEPTPVNQVFQFMQAGTCTAWSDGQPTKATSYLWIPEACTRLRGLVIMCANVPEHRLVGHEKIRKACTDNDLGIVWSTPSFMNFKRTEPGKPKMSEEHGTSVAFLQQQLDGLAKISGYAEVATVPWLPMGESGHLIMVDALMETRPDHCIAGIFIKNSHLPPKNRQTPTLVVYGTAQEWGQDKSDIRSQWNNVGKTYDGILNQRKNNPDWPFSYLIDGESGHFDCSERLTAYFARYIDLVAKARLSTDGSPTLKPIAITSGFVADLPVPGHAGKPVQAATAKSPLPWFFSEDQAKEAQAIASINWQAETQLPQFLDAQHQPLPHDFNGITAIKSVAFEADGLTFTVRTSLAETIPTDFLNPGEKLAQGPGTPTIEWLCGPLEPLGGNRFRIALDRVWLGGGGTYLGARQAGTPTIRGILEPTGVDLRSLRNAKGKAQKITFDPIPDPDSGATTVNLTASADSGLPVSFFVVAGPAIIDGGKAVLTSIPPRTKRPVEVTIAAWQWGRADEPQVRMAEIVRQTFRVK